MRGRTPKKTRKVLTIGKLKAKVWKEFSLYIRTRDSVNGYGNCSTCGEHVHYKEANAGHYIHGNTKPTYFDERNVHLQCVRCNKWLSGNLHKYALFLERTYGSGILQELEIKSKGPVYSRVRLEELLETYKQKLKNLTQ